MYIRFLLFRPTSRARRRSAIRGFTIKPAPNGGYPMLAVCLCTHVNVFTRGRIIVSARTQYMCTEYCAGTTVRALCARTCNSCKGSSLRRARCHTDLPSSFSINFPPRAPQGIHCGVEVSPQWRRGSRPGGWGQLVGGQVKGKGEEIIDEGEPRGSMVEVAFEDLEGRFDTEVSSQRVTQRRGMTEVVGNVIGRIRRQTGRKKKRNSRLFPITSVREFVLEAYPE